MSATPFPRDPIPFSRHTRAAVIVAHPDDETLWAGGIILDHPDWSWTIVALCRKSDSDRAPKFHRALERYGARGGIRDMDDGADQTPLSLENIENEVLAVLPSARYDLVLTHGPRGEYTRHVRHEETSRAVSRLWKNGRLDTREVWMFAYEDGDAQYLPKAIEHADITWEVSSHAWTEKHRIISEFYGFAPGSWEAQTTPRVEAFWRFRNPGEIDRWHEREG